MEKMLIETISSIKIKYFKENAFDNSKVETRKLPQLPFIGNYLIFNLFNFFFAFSLSMELYLQLFEEIYEFL